MQLNLYKNNMQKQQVKPNDKIYKKGGTRYNQTLPNKTVECGSMVTTVTPDTRTPGSNPGLCASLIGGYEFEPHREPGLAGYVYRKW